MRLADYRCAATGGLAPIRNTVPTATEYLTAFWTDYAGGSGTTGPWQPSRSRPKGSVTVQFNSPRGQRTYIRPWRGR